MDYINKEILYFLKKLNQTLDKGLKISTEVLKYTTDFKLQEREVSEGAFILNDFKKIKLDYLMFTIKLINFRKVDYFTSEEKFISLLYEFKKQQVLMLNSFLSYDFDIINLDYKEDSLRIEIMSLINELEFCIKSLKTFKAFDYL